MGHPAGPVSSLGGVGDENTREQLDNAMILVLVHPVKYGMEIGCPSPRGLFDDAVLSMAQRGPKTIVRNMNSRRRAADTAGVCPLGTGDPGSPTAASTTSSAAYNRTIPGLPSRSLSIFIVKTEGAQNYTWLTRRAYGRLIAHAQLFRAHVQAYNTQPHKLMTKSLYLNLCSRGTRSGGEKKPKMFVSDNT